MGHREVESSMTQMRVPGPACVKAYTHMIIVGSVIQLPRMRESHDALLSTSPLASLYTPSPDVRSQAMMQRHI